MADTNNFSQLNQNINNFNNFNKIGLHVLLDLYDCPQELLSNTLFLEEILIKTANQAGATILFHHFHHFGGEHGVTGVLLLAESHISIHTWTEKNFAAVDIFLCGEQANQSNLQQASEILIQSLQAKNYQIQIHSRG